MKIAVHIFLVIFAMAMVAGCGGKQTGIEGKVVDAKGQPVPGFKVVATQVESAQKYEQFQATTGPDGIFRFKGLLPGLEYSISPSPEAWKTSEKVTARSGQEGQMSALSSPMKIRFTVSKDGTITDSQLGLLWAPAPDRPMNWFQAQSYAQNFSVGGKGWRLPSRQELESLYETIKSDAGPAFRIQHNWVWTSDIEGDWAWAFNFSYGGNGKLLRNRSDSRFRALAVRSPGAKEQ